MSNTLFHTFFDLFLLFMQLFLQVFTGVTNSVDLDQTASSVAVWSGSALFAYAIFFRHFGIQNFRTFPILWLRLFQYVLPFADRIVFSCKIYMYHTFTSWATHKKGPYTICGQRTSRPDQHAHPCRLIWAISVCWCILQYPLIL